MRMMVCIEMDISADTTKRSEIKAAVKRELVKIARRQPDDLDGPTAKDWLLDKVDNEKFIVRAPEK